MLIYNDQNMCNFYCIKMLMKHVFYRHIMRQKGQYLNTLLDHQNDSLLSFI